MKEIMIALMMWISTQTGYNVNVTPPQIFFMTPDEVSDVCIDEGTLVPYVAMSCYKLHKHSIYMRNDFNINNPETVGVLVHELTHVLQLSNGKKYTLATMNGLEDEAEKIESVYEGNRTVQAHIQNLPGISEAPVQVAQAPPEPRHVFSQSYPQTTVGYQTGTDSGEPMVVVEPSFQPQPQTQVAATQCIPVEAYQSVDSERVALKKELSSVREQLQKMKDEVQALRREKETLVSRIEEYTAELNQYKKQVEDEAQRASGPQAVEETEAFQQAREENQGLRNENEDLRAELAQLRAEVMARQQPAAFSEEAGPPPVVSPAPVTPEPAPPVLTTQVQGFQAPVMSSPGERILVAQAPRNSAPDRNPPSDQLLFYTVRKGDTVYHIARRLGIGSKTIIDLNNLDKEALRNMKPGMRLKVPPPPPERSGGIQASSAGPPVFDGRQKRSYSGTWFVR